MSVIANAKGHFKTKLTDKLEWVECPEWDTKIYFKGSATLKQTEEIVALHRENKVAEALAQVLISRALNEDGSKMFTMADKNDLMNNVDPDVVTRMATHILNSEPKPADVEKN
jgi:Asp-tRNA(Asn)/Glu-tRNA(Gln) amidotransferase B subunit